MLSGVPGRWPLLDKQELQPKLRQGDFQCCQSDLTWGVNKVKAIAVAGHPTAIDASLNVAKYSARYKIFAGNDNA